jgi:[acyl-carrier-protein] S-malonyltransferase
VLVIVAPGQGAQTPGFLSPWLEDPAFAERLNWLSAVCGLDLAHYGSAADAETIRDTAIAQPLIVASGLLAALALFPHPADAFGKVGAAAGHSVGEISAAAGVGVMSAEVLARLAEHGLIPANDNGAGQIVAAGTMEQLSALGEDPPDKARLIPLSVAGAFHTEHMLPAVETLGRYARAISTHDPRTRLLSNRDGQVVHSGPDVMARLVRQVSHPVRWDLCMQSMLDMGVTGFMEVPPAGTLTGIARRAMKGVATFALKTPDQLDDARAFADEHGSASMLDSSPTWRMLVSPAKGTFVKTGSYAIGDSLPLDSSIGTVKTLRDETIVTAPYGGTVVEWLVEDGDLVGPGQPLIRLHPEVSS